MKNILITGSTDGIGKLVAIQFANEGHKVYIHGRNLEKVNATISEITATTNNENVAGFVADFSDLNAVKQMASQVKNEIDQIDILINNAGVFKAPTTLNKNGYDLRFVVNYLAPYLLTKELIPLIEKGNEARIINLSSAAQAPVSFDAMLGKTNVTLNESYAQSKLALTMWSFHLAKQQKEITVIAVNPGSLLNTKMANEAYGQHWSPANKGSDILYNLAIADEHKTKSGKYFDNDSGDYTPAHPNAYNEAAISQLIEQTDKLIELK